MALYTGDAKSGEVESLDDFESFKRNACGKLIVCFFYIEGHGPSTTLGVAVEALCQAKNIELCKVDLEKNVEVAEEYQIENVPEFIVYKDNSQVSVVMGFGPARHTSGVQLTQGTRWVACLVEKKS